MKFRIESNSYRWSQKSPVVSKYLLNKFNCFYGTTLLWFLLKQCQLDLAPTWLLKHFGDMIVPVLRSICNASFSAGRLPQSQKQAIVSARLKKPTLDPDDLNSYRPISNLSFVSKFVERAVAGRFVRHCEEHHLLPAKQSAYRRFHSTETAVLVV